MFMSLKNWLAAAALIVGINATAVSAEKVTVFAAASLTNAIDEIALEYQKQQPNQIVTVFASSSTLARQIEQGAPADIFISADLQWMNYLADKKRIEEDSNVMLLGNKLVLIAPKNSKTNQVDIQHNTDWLALLDGGRLSVGDPDHVPVGIYAKEALQNLGSWQALEPKLARADNVRSALLMVERAETPLGIVYGSDAVVSDKVKVVGAFPADSHKPVEYPMAIVKGHKNPAVGHFYQYLKSDDAKAIFERYGFTPL